MKVEKEDENNNESELAI